MHGVEKSSALPRKKSTGGGSARLSNMLGYSASDHVTAGAFNRAASLSPAATRSCISASLLARAARCPATTENARSGAASAARPEPNRATSAASVFSPTPGIWSSTSSARTSASRSAVIRNSTKARRRRAPLRPPLGSLATGPGEARPAPCGRPTRHRIRPTRPALPAPVAARRPVANRSW